MTDRATSDPLLEKLAALEHQQWVAWSKNLVENEHALTKYRRERWQKLWIPYSQLSEETKEQDRVWARKVLEAVLSSGLIVQEEDSTGP